MIELATLQAVSYIMGSLGVFVAALYYVMNIRTTQRNMKANLETRRAQLFMGLYQSLSSRDFVEAEFTLARAQPLNHILY